MAVLKFPTIMFHLLQDVASSATQTITQPNVQNSINLDWGNVLSGAIGGLIAVVVTLLAEFLIRRYEKSQEKRDQEIVRFKNQTRKITGSIFTYLGPDASVEMMKSDLGPPNKQYQTDAGLFSIEYSTEYPPLTDEETEYVPRFTAYLYFFQNAHVKVISEDKESIVAITVMAHDDSVSMPEEDTKFLNKYKIETSFFEDSHTVAEHFPGCRDTVTAICSRHYMPGMEIATTYFCEDLEKDFYNADLKNNPKELVGATVYGVCLSKGIENTSYIYLSEII